MPPDENLDHEQKQNLTENHARGAKKHSAKSDILLAVLTIICLGIVIASGIAIMRFKDDLLNSSETQQSETSNTAKIDSKHSDDAEDTEKTEQSSKYAPEAHPRDLELSDADGQRIWDMTNMSFKNMNFSIENDRYFKNAAEIRSYMSGKEKHKDPATGKPYVFTDSLPKRGEMQYKLGFECQKNTRGLGEKKNQRVFAFMVMMDDGSYMCKSNIQ